MQTWPWPCLAVSNPSYLRWAWSWGQPQLIASCRYLHGGAWCPGLEATPSCPSSCSRGGIQFKITSLNFDVYIQEGGFSAPIVSTYITKMVSRVIPGSFCHLAHFGHLHDLNSPSLQNELCRSKLPIGKILWSVLIHLSLEDFATVSSWPQPKSCYCPEP